MAVTTESSTQVGNVEASPPVLLDPRDNHGRVRFARFSFTQGAAAGDATSKQRLVKLPAGKVRVILPLSRVAHSAFGAARTLSLGHEAYETAGVAVAEDLADLDTGVDVSAAGSFIPTGTLGGDETKEFDSDEGVVITASNAGGTIPAAATLQGHIAYVVD